MGGTPSGDESCTRSPPPEPGSRSGTRAVRSGCSYPSHARGKRGRGVTPAPPGVLDPLHRGAVAPVYWRRKRESAKWHAVSERWAGSGLCLSVRQRRPDRWRARAEAALLEQHPHGYIDDETLHREMTSVRAQLAAIPASDDKVVVFDNYRHPSARSPRSFLPPRRRSCGSSSRWSASESRRRTARCPGWCGRRRRGRSSVWLSRPRTASGAQHPTDADDDALRGVWRPRRDSGPQHPTSAPSDDPLDWYAAS